MPPSANPSHDASASAAVFGGGVQLADDELDAIGRALIEVVVPLSTTWTELVGQPMEAAIGTIGPGPTPRSPDLEPDPTASILDSLTEGGAFVAVGWLGHELGTAVLIVPTALGLAVVDLLLGGTGRPVGERSLSAIDLDLLKGIAEPTLATLRHVGPPERLADPVEILDDLEEPDLVARIIGGITVDVEVTIAEQTRPFQLVLSANAARHLTGAATLAAAEAGEVDARSTLAHVLAEVTLEAVVTFPPVKLASHRILALDVGDVIALGTPPDRPLPLTVDGRHLADVRPARVGNDVACQIVSTTVGARADRHVDPHLGGLL